MESDVGKDIILAVLTSSGGQGSNSGGRTRHA